MKHIRVLLFFLCTIALAPSASAELVIRGDYPGGNIIVEKQAPGTVELRQDYHTSSRWWFYWNFEATAVPGEAVTFSFTDGKVIGTRGPAFSLDQGKTWAWLGTDTVDADKRMTAFRYSFPESGGPVRFAFAPPYQTSDLERYLSTASGHSALTVDSLCQSEGNRDVPRIRIGTQDSPMHRVLLTARHHACESMASYVLEGIFATLLGDSEDGVWFRNNVEVLALPMVDVDGVEQGEQGKNRSPRDHGRDYKGKSLYNSTRAIRDTVPAWSEGRLRFTLDIHCPHIRGGGNEHIYLVGHERPEIWKEQQRFAHLLEAVPDSPLPYKAANDMPFGKSWNTAANYTAGAGIFQWAGNLPGVRHAGAIEIPYANVGDVTVTTEKARAFGATLVTAMRHYLESLDE